MASKSSSVCSFWITSCGNDEEVKPILAHILQSDNDSEFTAQIISDLKELLPELVIVHGKPCHPQSQGSVERANYDIKDMLVA
jgi:hypothetical protein